MRRNLVPALVLCGVFLAAGVALAGAMDDVAVRHHDNGKVSIVNRGDRQVTAMVSLVCTGSADPVSLWMRPGRQVRVNISPRGESGVFGGSVGECSVNIDAAFYRRSVTAPTLRNAARVR